jgi:outer membrane biosynthesis protein TonB
MASSQTYHFAERPIGGPATSFSDEDRLGLLVAVMLHLGVLAVFVLQPAEREPLPMPERMTVNLAEDVGLVAASSDPVSESRAAIAPELSDLPAPAPELSDQAPRNPAVTDAPPPTAAARAQPPRTAPSRTASPRPRDRADQRPRRRPDTRPPNRTADRPRPPRPAQRSGGSRVGDDFLSGAGASTTSNETRIPASQIGASAKASIVQAIARQIKPHWTAPSGVDSEQLVTVLSFRLNEDGSLNGRPQVVSQSGVTASNTPQKDLHAERAIRAVQRAAPFDLPPRYYNAWKVIAQWRFDRRL